MNVKTTLAVSATIALSACASTMGGMPQPMGYSQDSLPAAVQVPAGHKVTMETVGVGQITYECRAKKDMAGQHEWVFVGPDARLMDRAGKPVGKYFGPPGRARTVPDLPARRLRLHRPPLAPSHCSSSRRTRPWAWARCRA
jgi:hypothetical protein